MIDRIIFGKTGNSKPQLKRFLSEAQDKGLTPKSLWDDCGTATDGTKEILDLFGSKAFDTPKPVGLVNKIIELATSGDDLILDFFAGFRVIIMTQANSQVNTRVLELLPKFKIKKMNRWFAV
ncbi:MAG: DNA methyltransferase [Candidatus Cryptobacteroides sp.]